MSEQDVIDELIMKIMLANSEYDEMDRVFALNGIIYEGYFNELSADEQEDLMQRLAIGIQTFNADIKDRITKSQDWRRLPDLLTSGVEDE